jgi:hypothetical protein
MIEKGAAHWLKCQACCLLQTRLGCCDYKNSFHPICQDIEDDCYLLEVFITFALISLCKLSTVRKLIRMEIGFSGWQTWGNTVS